MEEENTDEITNNDIAIIDAGNLNEREIIDYGIKSKMMDKMITTNNSDFLKKKHHKKIFIILCINSKHREYIYSYLDRKYPLVGKKSLYIDAFLTEQILYVRCTCMREIGLAIEKYGDCYAGYCSICYKYIRWNHRNGFEKIIKVESRKNSIIMGGYIPSSKWKSPKVFPLTMEDCEEMLNMKLLYCIDEPEEANIDLSIYINNLFIDHGYC